MRLSTRSRYGMRILVQIACDCREKDCVRGRVVAEKQGISEAYLEQILIPLKTSGLVRTVRGRNGGYALNVDPASISVLDVIELFEGPFELAECETEDKRCERVEKCPMYEVWHRLSEVMRREAAKITLAELAEKNLRLEEKIPLNYVI